MAAERLCLNVLWVLLAWLHLEICHRSRQVLCAAADCPNCEPAVVMVIKRIKQRTPYLMDRVFCGCCGDVNLSAQPAGTLRIKGQASVANNASCWLGRRLPKSKGTLELAEPCRNHEPSTKDSCRTTNICAIYLARRSVSREARLVTFGPKPQMWLSCNFGIESETQENCGCWKPVKASPTCGSIDL